MPGMIRCASTSPSTAWRRSILALAVTAFLVVPRGAQAAPVWVSFSLAFNYGDLEFGPALSYARIVEQGLGEAYDVVWVGDDELRIVDGTLDMWTGRLVQVMPNGWGDATYVHHGGGGIVLHFSLQLPDGSLHHGTFQAPLGGYVIYADADGGGGDTDGRLKSGLFDDATARLLGIYRRTRPTTQSWYLDSYDSYPEPYRVAKSFGYLDIPARTVPEPGTGVLSLAAGLAYAVRRMMRASA